jgi:hypothetical protein
MLGVHPDELRPSRAAGVLVVVPHLHVLVLPAERGQVMKFHPIGATFSSRVTWKS